MYIIIDYRHNIVELILEHRTSSPMDKNCFDRHPMTQPINEKKSSSSTAYIHNSNEMMMKDHKKKMKR